MSDPCTLCRIASQEMPVPLLHEDDLVVAFEIPVGHEANRAPVHLLIIPKEHVKSGRELEPHHEPMLGRLVTRRRQACRGEGHRRNRLPPPLQHRPRRQPD